MRKGQIRYSRGYRPNTRLRARRNKQANLRKRGVIFLWVLFLLLILSYVIFLSPIFKIEQIKISGNEVVSNQEIIQSLDKFRFKNLLGFFNYDNLFLVTEKRLNQAIIGDLHRISEIKLSKRIFKKTVTLTVTERKEAGIFCKQKCYYIDNSGVIFETAPETSGVLILTIKDEAPGEVQEGKKVIDQQLIEKFFNVQNYLTQRLNLKALDFVINSDTFKNVKVNTNEGWYILFDQSGDFEKQLQALELSLAQAVKEDRTNLEYIDLRVDKRVYYK